LKKKKTKMLFAFITAALMSTSCLWYVYLTITGNIHPTLMTWVMFFIAVSLSFLTYRSTKNNNLLDNVCNTIDLFSVTLTLIFIVFFGKNIRFSLNLFEVICIIFSLVVLIFWKITKAHEVSNMMLQIIMTVAYFPTFYQLWSAAEPTESLMTWGIVWVYSLTGVITGLIAKNKLAVIYSFRSLILVTVIMILILRI
jgi:hypothetical protein